MRDGQSTGGANVDKDPAEQEMLARGIGDELTEIFVRFVRGMPSWSNNTSCSCFGDPRFTSRPMAA